MSAGIVIDFADGKRKVLDDRAVGRKARQKRATPLIESLATSVEAAQQAEKARVMLYQGYVGAQMKEVIRQANTLGNHLVDAGRLVQQLLLNTQEDEL